MICRVAFGIFIVFAVSGWAQSPDSLRVKSPLDTLTIANPLDSLPGLSNIDSLYSKPLEKLDSIQIETNARLSTLNLEYDSVNKEFDSQIAKLTHKKDSLTDLRLPTTSVDKKIDSLQNLRITQLDHVRSKAKEVQSKAVSEINKLHLSPQMQGKVKELTSAIDNVDVALPKTNLNLPHINVKEWGNISAPGVNLPNAQVPGINGVPDTSLPGANLPTVDNPIGYKVSDITGEMKDIQGQVPTSVDDVAQKAEGALGEVDGMGELKDNLPAQTTLPDEAAAKEQLANQAKKAAVNHFAGKEEQLKAAMDKMAKYKQKYSSVQSIKDLPKRPPNPLKGKPFIERVVPSVTLQVLKRNDWLMDIAPYVGYRFTPRLSAGLGWNERIAFQPMNTDTKVYGPRIYGEYRVFKGVSGRLELETMNTFVSKNGVIGSDQGQREWVPAILAGMKKQYKIFKNLKGTAFMLYNFYNPHYKSPYGDRLNVRFGFEYSIRKKKK